MQKTCKENRYGQKNRSVRAASGPGSGVLPLLPGRVSEPHRRAYAGAAVLLRVAAPGKEAAGACQKLPLDARQAQVIRLRYGLEDGCFHPQHEVAKRLGISRSYVSRIEKRALEILKNHME